MQQINLNEKPDKEKKFNFPSQEELKELLLVKYKRVTIMCGTALALFIVLLVMSSSFEQSEKAAQVAYNKYQSDLKAMNSKEDEVQKVILPSETAVDIDKINNDIRAAEAYIKTFFTWTNGEEYDAVREKVHETFGADSDIGVFFFENVKTHTSGKSMVDIYSINMVCRNMKTYPTAINDDGSNEYLSVIIIESHKNGVTTQYPISMRYTFDGENLITDADVYFFNRS